MEFIPPEKTRLAEFLSKTQPTPEFPFRNFVGELSPADVDELFVNVFDPMCRKELEKNIRDLFDEASTKNVTSEFKATLSNQREGKNVKGTVPDEKEELELLKLLSQPPRYP